MLSISDPYDLKAADVYRQACTVASKTSRGSDSNWYRDPQDIAFQWHIWFDGGREVCSATLSRSDNCWRQGPALPLASLTTGEGVNELLGELLSPTYFGQKPGSLGVILHVGDEFSLAEVFQGAKAEGEAAEDLNVLRYNLIDSPKDVLADRDVSVDSISWRLLPFWGAPSGQTRCAAVALPRQRETFLRSLVEGGEAWRVPIRVAVTSAPVEALASLALLLPTMQGGGLIAFPYLKFTAVFALTEGGELRACRSLAHRGGNALPASFGDILWNMAVSAELVTHDGAGQMLPRLVIASANRATLEEAVREMELYSIKRQRIVCETLDLADHAATAALPGNRPELLPYDPGAISQCRLVETGLPASPTFRALWDGWASQNFYHTSKVDALYPSLSDLRLLGFSKWFVLLLTLAFLSTSVYGVYGLYSAMWHPSWELTPEQVKTSEGQLKKLHGEQKQIDITERLLLPRSQGWSSLEFLFQLFPEEAGVRLENFNYSVEAVPVSNKAGVAAGDAIGLIREWSFRGLAKARTLDVLNNLNSQRGLNAFFEKVAQATGDSSYTPDPTRQVRLTLTQGRNGRYTAEPASEDVARDPSISYPFTFEATITQTLSEKDPLALPSGKPF